MAGSAPPPPPPLPAVGARVVGGTVGAPGLGSGAGVAARALTTVRPPAIALPVEEEEEVALCPLCLEELDLTDTSIVPCNCGYQMCLLCYHRLKQQAKPCCPACRAPYTPESTTIFPVDPTIAAADVKRKKARRKAAARAHPPLPVAPAEVGPPPMVSLPPPSPAARSPPPLLPPVAFVAVSTAPPRLPLASATAPPAPLSGSAGSAAKSAGAPVPSPIAAAAASSSSSVAAATPKPLVLAVPAPTPGARILARTIVHVAGLAPVGDAVARRRHRAFGRYGRVARVLVMPRGGSAAGGGGLYVVYAREADAAAAVRGMTAGGVDGRDVKVGLATTRYCDEFLAHGKHQCGREGCLHLHQVASRPEDVFTREEASARRLPPPPPSFLFSSSTGLSSQSSGPPPPTALPATSNRAPAVPVAVLPVSLPGRARRLSPSRLAVSTATGILASTAAPSSAGQSAVAAPAPLPVASLSPGRLSLAASVSGRRRFPPPSREAAGGWGAAADAIDASSPAAAAAAARAASKAASAPGSTRKAVVALSGKGLSMSTPSGVAPSMTLSPSSAWSSSGGQAAWTTQPTVWSAPPTSTVWSSPPVLGRTSPARSLPSEAASSSSGATGPTLRRSAVLRAAARDAAPPASAWACVPAAVARPAPAAGAIGGSFRPTPSPPPGFAPPGFGPLPATAASTRSVTNEWDSTPASGGAGNLRSLGQPRLAGDAGHPSGAAAPGGPGCVTTRPPAAATTATAAPSDTRIGAPRLPASDRVAVVGTGPSPGLTSPLPVLTGSPIHPSPRTSPRSCSRFGFARRREGVVGGGGATGALTPVAAPASAPPAPLLLSVGGSGDGDIVEGSGVGDTRTVPDFLGAPGATGGSAGRPARSLPVLGAVLPTAGGLPPPSPPAACRAVGGGRVGTGGRRPEPSLGFGAQASLSAAAPVAALPVGASRQSSLGLGPSLSELAGAHHGTPPSPAVPLGPGALESIPSNMSVSPTRGSPPGDSVDSSPTTPTLLSLLESTEVSTSVPPHRTALSIASAAPSLAAGGPSSDAGTRATTGCGGGDGIASTKRSTPLAPPGFGPPRCVPSSDAFLVAEQSLDTSFCETLAPVSTSVSNVTLPPPSPSSGSTSIVSSPGLTVEAGPRLPLPPSCSASRATPPESSPPTRSSALGGRASPSVAATAQRPTAPAPPRSRLLATGIMDAAHAVWRSLVMAASGVGRSSKGGGVWRVAGADGDEGSSATEDDGEAGDAGSGDDVGSQPDHDVDELDDDELGEEVEEEEDNYSRFPPSSTSVASMGMPCGQSDSTSAGRYGALVPSWGAEGET